MSSMTTTITTTVNQTMEKAKKTQELAVAKAKKTYTSIVRDPNFKTHTVATAGGAITFGAVGGAFGTAAGVVVGSAAGLIPALFTFGLSIPAGAVVGGTTGLTLGSGSGAVVGGAAGFGGYKYRVQIKDGVICIKKAAFTKADNAKTKAAGTTKAVFDWASGKLAKYSADGRAQVTVFQQKAKALVDSTTKTTKALAATKYGQALTIAKDRKVQVTTASAATGGVAGGVTGGTCGLVAGAALGVVPALFTFGLSIPIGATIGLTTGAVSGSAIGAVGCGSAGYVGYTKRKEISNGVQEAVKKTSASVDYVKIKTVDSVKALVGAGGTGETA